MSAVLSYPTGGNKERGIHNDKYDGKLLDLIMQSSLDHNFTELSKYYSSLDLEDYKYDLELEDRMFFQGDYSTLLNRLAGSSITY